MEGKIDMAARRQVTNKLRNAYSKASKKDKGRILDQVQETTGLARSSARRYLTGPPLPPPKDQVDRRALKARGYSDDTRMLLEHVWRLMGMPCGKYLVVMRGQWLPLFDAAGDLDKPFATDSARAELEQMSAATSISVSETGSSGDGVAWNFGNETSQVAADFDQDSHRWR